MLKKLFLSIVLVGSVGFAFSERQCIKLIESGRIKCPTHYYIVEPVKLMPYLIKFHKELNLTEKQKKEIKSLIKEIKERIIPLDREIDRVSQKLRQDMVKIDDKNYIRAEMYYLAALKVRRSMYNYYCIQSLKKILSKEQFEKLLHLMERVK